MLECRNLPSQQPKMNRTALTAIAPEIFRKRLIVEGYYTTVMGEEAIRAYFADITAALNLRTYGDPVIHRTSGQGRPENEGFDGFVPLIDSGIYVAAWTYKRFLSTVLYTCANFDEDVAVAKVASIFGLQQHEAAVF